MKYMGSKRRISKEILTIILKERKPEQWYVEPFCGGCNSLDKVDNPRIGSDINEYLIALLKEIQKQIPFNPPHIGEKEYKEIQHDKEKYPKWLVGYVGFNLSFGAKFFGGYRRDKAGIRNYENEAQQNIKAQQNNLMGIYFHCCNYDELFVPKGSIVYCDPPYKDTTKYQSKFDYEKFYEWCREKSKTNTVFISEYWMPEDFKCVWEKELSSNLDVSSTGKRNIEKLFTIA
jgi:DNA adenine methylase